ncbi:Alpha/Beta hydrolase protein [Desarmillaria tabescens]|uniref:Alpha/Beta hydrolase protein n=1 Tax=Armillaria tabescens TaxID=1929756 RepID=A0AA39N6F6_ARMTA|nr:Alpha/Beta hydrolase protein [Desarmillaria tabescens]KAK0459856.1 Alpha/Beta hydrolase protein [Desarmillaria tabescens]
MDSSLYKDFTTSRGFVYHYFLYLLFLHGFPSTSFDWRHQVPFFANEGYGLIVPDMLGYGGTSKPTDPADYRASLITKDIVELIDGENAERVVAIGHDWGSKVSSRLANYYPDRFIAYGFLAVGYVLPRFENNYEQFLALSKETFGYEIFGYWSFLSSPGADKIIEDNMESFLRLIYSQDRKLSVSDFAPTGKVDNPIASYITEENCLMVAWTGCLNWYTVMTSGVDAEDNKEISADNLEITKPVFYGGALQDAVALNVVNKTATTEKCKNTTLHEYDGGHWIIWETKDDINRDLLDWLKAL